MSGPFRPAAAAGKAQSEALNFRLTLELMQALKTAARKDGVRVSDIVRQSLERDMTLRAGHQPECLLSLAELDQRLQLLLDQQASILVHQNSSADAAHTSALQSITIMTALFHIMQALGLDALKGRAAA
ncbi:hypothetical protein [Polaromonas sp.]|uniref:hypothetical protein n=1 Tax=Polaromonas sp. TaxID=1869339 RepID=UPI0013B715B5|nr:hypothetical protein [Polaromonas sp.]NDP63065.1 hypothetical protein [Polaromonas sp.]